MITNSLEIRIVSQSLEQPLIEFFQILKEAGDDQRFHPHPFTDEVANEIVNYSGQDLYYVLIAENKALGYGMLRGWDEGYSVPSLGIAIHPETRGMGYGKLLMHFLHTAARRKGAQKIRLKVYPDNIPAIALYKQLGYTFQSEDAGQKIGYLTL